MKNEFDLVFENVLSAFGDELSTDTPQLDSVEIQIVQGDSPAEITKKLKTQVKGLRKVASGNDEGSKIYYRTRNIEKLVTQLQSALGVASNDEEDYNDSSKDPRSVLSDDDTSDYAYREYIDNNPHLDH